jgi:hypothetical protein
MATLLRVRGIYGPGNAIPVGHTNFWANFVHDENGPPVQNIPGTDVPKLRLVNIGLRARAAFDDEVYALVEGLRAWRDKGRPAFEDLHAAPDKTRSRKPAATQRPEQRRHR